jgi:hypothetical protein
MTSSVALMAAACVSTAPLHASVVDGSQFLLSPGTTHISPDNPDTTVYGLPANCVAYLPAHFSPPAVATLIRYRSTVDGDIKDPMLFRTSGNAALDSAVLACVKDRRTKPITINGAPVEMTRVLGYEWRRYPGYFIFDP